MSRSNIPTRQLRFSLWSIITALILGSLFTAADGVRSATHAAPLAFNQTQTTQETNAPAFRNRRSNKNRTNRNRSNNGSRYRYRSYNNHSSGPTDPMVLWIVAGVIILVVGIWLYNRWKDSQEGEW